MQLSQLLVQLNKHYYKFDIVRVMEYNKEARFFEMAEAYDKMAQKLVPKYDFLQDEVFNIIDFNSEQPIIVVDIGAGSGIFLDKFLNNFKYSKAYWVDISEEFLHVAQNRLSGYNERINYIISDFDSDWEIKITEESDIILSMSAIHHLVDNAKQELYKKCYNLLKTGGWFFNIDETKTIFENSYKNSLLFWVNHVDTYKNIVEDIEYYQKWKYHFDNWKVRNIDDFNTPKVKGDDLHASFIDQVKWLNEIGFKNADVFVKYHLWAIMGGKK